MAGAVAAGSLVAGMQSVAMTSAAGFAVLGSPAGAIVAGAVAGAAGVAAVGVVAAVGYTKAVDRAGAPGGKGRFVVGRHDWGKVEFFFRDSYEDAVAVFHQMATRRILFELTPREVHLHQHRGEREWKEHAHKGANVLVDNEIANALQARVDAR